MKNNVIAVVISIFLCSVSLIHAGIMEDLQSARLAISGDFNEISKWVTNEITEGLAFTAGSGNVLPADVIEFPVLNSVFQQGHHYGLLMQESLERLNLI